MLEVQKLAEPRQVAFAENLEERRFQFFDLDLRVLEQVHAFKRRREARLREISHWTIADRQAYLQDGVLAKVPARHLALTVQPFDFLFARENGGVKGGQHAVLELGDEVCPCYGIFDAGGPRELHTSASNIK